MGDTTIRLPYVILSDDEIERVRNIAGVILVERPWGWSHLIYVTIQNDETAEEVVARIGEVLG